MGNKSSTEEKLGAELSSNEMKEWKKSFEAYRVFERRSVSNSEILVGIPVLLWKELILPFLLAPKGSCDSCTFVLGKKNYFTLRLICKQFYWIICGDDNTSMWKKVVSRALGKDSLRAFGEIFWDEKNKTIHDRVLISIGSYYYASIFDKSWQLEMMILSMHRKFIAR